VVGITTLIQELELVRLESGLLDGIGSAESVLEVVTRAEVPHLRLHHRPEISRSVMPKIHHSARIAVEDDHHTTADLRSWCSHYEDLI
jgi:hypothetical protein